MAIIKEAKRTTIISNGIDTTSLIDKSAYRGIEYTKSGDKAKAAQDPKNYVLGLQFPVITNDKNGNLTSTYTDKENKTQLAHGYTTASVSANMATMSDVEAVMANDVRKDGKDAFENVRSKDGVKGVPIATNTVTLGGKTTFEIDAEALASVSAKERNIANAGKNIPKRDEGNKARLDLTLSQVKATVDGVAKVSPESLKAGLTSTATTSYIASNSETHNNGRNKFDAKTIESAGKVLTNSYEKAFNDVAKALAAGKSLDALRSTRDKSQALAGTGLANGMSVKLIDVDGVKAFVQKPGADATKVKNDMKAVASAVEARANAYKAQDAFANKDKMNGTAYNLVNATRFSVPPIGLKQTDDKGNTKNAGFTVLSPSTAGMVSPTGANVARLNAAAKAPTLEETKRVIGPTVLDDVEAMAKDVVGNEPQRTQEQARAAQNAVIDKVRAEVEKAGKAYDSIGKGPDGPGGAGSLGDSGKTDKIDKTDKTDKADKADEKPKSPRDSKTFKKLEDIKNSKDDKDGKDGKGDKDDNDHDIK